jgi:hypothetical protein
MKKISLPKADKNENRKLIQAEVSLDLWRSVEKEMRSRGYTWRQVVEFGLNIFLLNANPTEAHKLGIRED